MTQIPLPYIWGNEQGKKDDLNSIWYPSCFIVAQGLSRIAWSYLYNWYLQLVSFFWHAFLDFHMVGCFSTSFLSSATYMGENRCFTMTHIFERKYQSLQLVTILFLVFIWCHVFQVVEFDPHYVKYKCIHLVRWFKYYCTHLGGAKSIACVFVTNMFSKWYLL